MADSTVAESRVNSCIQEINDLLEICRTPSISYGVIHEGRILCQKGIGLRNVELNLPSDEETIYMISSCSKMFLAAAVAILDAENKLSLDDPINKYVPGFQPVGDHLIGKNATIRDALSHRTGLGKQQPLLFGPKGVLIASVDSFVDLVNEATTEDQVGQRFERKHYAYNSFAYGIVSLVVESASGHLYADFLQKYIFEPLEMTQTIVHRQALSETVNMAHGYAKLQSGEWAKINTEEFTTELHSPVLSVAGIRTSVTDLLKWCMALLEASEKSSPGNPLRQVNVLWEPQVDIEPDISYCLGFYRGILPTPAFGGIGLNENLRYSDEEAFKDYILGRDSPPRRFIGHSGNWNGFATSIYIFPDTKSAVVALTNGMDLGDAADFTTKILTQALFDARPKVDFLDYAKREAELFKKWFERILVDWRNNKGKVEKEASLEEYIGFYRALTTTIEVFVDHETARLAFTINNKLETKFDLELYDEDTYSFFPHSRDQWLRNAMLDWDDYKVGLFHFQRDAQGNVKELRWTYEAYEPTGRFLRIKEDFADGKFEEPMADDAMVDKVMVDKQLTEKSNVNAKDNWWSRIFGWSFG